MKKIYFSKALEKEKEKAMNASDKTEEVVKSTTELLSPQEKECEEITK